MTLHFFNKTAEVGTGPLEIVESVPRKRVLTVEGRGGSTNVYERLMAQGYEC